MDPADEGQSEASTTATNVVWVFRIVLPIFLFILWHRLQAPAGTGGKCCYPRDTVMAARQPPAKSMDDAPECLQGLRLVDEGTAQRLLGLPPPRVSSSSAGGGRREARGPRQRGGRGGNEGRRSEEWLEAELMDEAHLHAEAAHGFPQENGKGHAQGQGHGQGQGQGDTAPAPAATTAAVSAEDLAARSALLGSLALGHGRPQRRSFLHDELRPPPPPPPSARQAQALAGQAPDAAAVARMNAEARTVLRGLLSLRQAVLTPLPAPAAASASASAGTAGTAGTAGMAGMAGVATGPPWTEVPRRVQRQLQEALVPADAATFALLVEASASLADLPAASDFLMKMENAGHCAGNELLDMVMDLYAEGSSGAAGNAGNGGNGGNGGKAALTVEGAAGSSWAEEEEESEMMC